MDEVVLQEKTSDKELELELGDIITISAPTNGEINDKIFLIDYIDSSTIRLLDTLTFKLVFINIENNAFTDESIESISILSKEQEKGYARQNGLLPNTWVEIKFGGDVPVIIVAEITDLQNDMIELTTYPDKDVLYIDFGYKGLPLNIPIEEIIIRDKPEGLTEKPTAISASIPDVEGETGVQTEGETEEELGVQTEDDITYQDIKLALPKEELEKQLQDVLVQEDEIFFGEIKEITQEVQVSESEKRFSLEDQRNDLLDEMLSTIPNVERTNKVLNKIHLMIERFTQLRELYSKKNDNYVITGTLKKTSTYKPLVKSLQSLKNNLYWLLPIVKNKRNIYDITDKGADDEVLMSLSEDIIPSHSVNMVRNIEIAIEKYKQKSKTDSTNNYSDFIQSILKELNEYESPDLNSISTEIYPEENINVVIDNIVKNLQDFYCSVVTNDTLMKKRFVISKYSLGQQMLKSYEMRGSFMKTNRQILTRGKPVPIKGFMTLPNSYVEYSKINLPGTSIYDKTNLNNINLSYWKTLKRSTSIVKNTITNLDEPLKYETNNFIDSIKTYVLSDEFNEIDNQEVKKRTYQRFLEAFIPTIDVIFENYKMYIKNGVSIERVIKQMEPFLIYREDLTIGQYKIMREYIEENLLKLKKQITFNSKDTNIIRNLKTRANFVNSIMLLMLGPQLYDVNVAYNLKDDKTYTTDFYSRMMTTDYGEYYNTIIQNITRDLYVDINIEEKLNSTLDNLTTRIESDTADDSCKTNELVKTYFTMEELDKDDNREDVYYDKKYDPTRYEFLDEYKTEMQTYEPDDFRVFLTQKLKENVGMSNNDAENEAQALINGKRKIQNGNYAVLIGDSTGQDTAYFKRENNRWQLDTTLTGVPISENSTAFCNINDKCVSIEDECASIEDTKEKIIKKTVEEITKNMQDNENVYLENLQARLTNFSYLLTEIMRLKHVMKIKNNNKFYKYGLDVNEESIIISPYAELFSLILSQRDFSKRMQDINKFILSFTRNYNPEDANESEFWYYCNKTNTKLLPTFYGTLSKAYIYNSDFLYTLDQICAERGEISDDGDKWVDKHSGYTIRMIDLSSDEGYDESGFAIQTSETLEEISEKLLEEQPKESDELQNTKEGIIVSNILNALGLYSGIELKDKSEMIRGILVHSIKQVGSKTKYEQKVKALALKGKKMIPYEQKRNQLFLFFAGLYFLIYVQTSIPSIRTRKTFPGCVKSFVGFPLTTDGDISGLTYVACIMKKISSSQTPWNSIKGVGESNLIKNMEIIYDKILSIDSIIIRRLTEKRQVIESGDEPEFIPDDVDISKWNTFLPPLMPIIQKQPQNISPAFKSDLNNEIKKGSFKQIPMLSTIKSKIMFFSLNIQSEIEKIINKQDGLLKTSSNIPFLENMCCNGDNSKSTLDFFTEKSKQIITDNEIIQELRELYNSTLALSKSSVLLDKRDTKLKYPSVNKEFGEKTVYQGFIKYCKINKEEPIDDSIKVFCPDKTSDFTTMNTLSEKIEIMKKEGKDYNSDMFIELLNNMNKQHVVTTNFDTIIPKTHERLIYVLTHLKAKMDEDTNQVSPSLLTILEKVVEYIGEFRESMNDTIRKFKNYLLVSIENYKKSIVSYITEKSNLNKKEKKEITEFIENINHFNRFDKSELLTSEENTDMKTIDFLKNCLYHVIREYPNIILNQVDYSNITIHKHWNLSDKHKTDVKEMLKKNYELLKQFYGNDDLVPLLYEIQNMTIDIVKLIEHTPITRDNANGEKDVFHTDLVKYLFIFYLFSIFEKYIELETLVLSEEYAVLEDSTNILEDESSRTIQEAQQQSDIMEGNKVQVQKLLASLIGSYILIFNRQKQRINMNREEIMKLVLRSKEREKNVKTRQLKELTDEERNVDSELRKAKLGQWNIGLQKGLTQYDKDFYDIERGEMEQEALIEAKLGTISDVTTMNRDIYAMDVLNEELSNLETEREANDMSLFADDDDFGDNDGDEYY